MKGKEKTTPFGKELKKLRVDREISLRELSRLLEAETKITYASLNVYERRRCNVPDRVVNAIIKAFSLNGEEAERLWHARDLSRKTFYISLEGCTDAQREVAILFARTLPYLTNDDLDYIREILEGHGKK